METDPKPLLIQIGREFHQRGWSRGTSSNYSSVVSRDPLRLCITASGWDKGALTEDGFVTVDERGRKLEDGSEGKPSAETLLHTAIVRRTGAGAVLHCHSPWATILSHHFAKADGDGELILTDFEMLKGLEGIKTHQTTVTIPIFDNTQDMPALAEHLETRFDDPDSAPTYGFILRRHGLYTWGADLATARRHVEILEFLFEVTGLELCIAQPTLTSR